MLVAEGTERVRVLEWAPDDPYPRATVERAPDPAWDGDADHALAAAIDAFRDVLAVATELGADVDPGVLDLHGEPATDGWLLVGRAPVGPLDRHELLCAPTPSARLHLLAEQLADLRTVLASRLRGG